MTGSNSRWIGGSVMGLVLIAGCGNGATGSSSSAPTSTSVSTSNTPSSTPSPPSSTGVSPSMSSPGDVTLRGTVRGDGLTCVAFVATNGSRYALAGPGLPSKVRDVAGSLGRRTSLSDQPSPPQIATLTIIGHVVAGVKSTCNLSTFLVTSAKVASIGPQ